MVCKQPSRITASGIRLPSPVRRLSARPSTAPPQSEAPSSHHAIREVAARIGRVLLPLMLLTAACCSSAPVAAASGDEIFRARPVTADLDDDGVDETIRITDERRLLIDDDPAGYHSRDLWQIAQAFLGDTDGNGLLEIVALLDDERGRHLGLIAWMGDRYRERIVTRALTPRPVALEVVPKAESDIVILDEESASAPGGIVRTLYRWNGFGFTAVGEAGP